MSKPEPIRPVVLVTRATGSSGGVVRRIRERGRFAVRAMSRTPDSAAGRALAASGIQVVAGDLDDVDALRNAMAGCFGVVGYTGADACGRSWQRVVNLLDAGADAGVGFVVIGIYRCGGSTAGGEITRMEAFARTVGVPVAFVDVSGEVDVGAVIASAFEERVDAMLRM